MPNYEQQERAAESFAGVTPYFDGKAGKIVRSSERNLWWVAEGDTEKMMFSLRRDGVWRPFPGPADGPGLRTAKKQSKVKVQSR